MDIRAKKQLVQQNIYNCKFGIYKNFQLGRTQKNFFSGNLNLAPPYEFCSVEVMGTHPIDTAYGYHTQGFHPAVFTLVTPEFPGDNINTWEGFKDDFFFLRTNINLSFNSFNLYPLKDSEVTYAPAVYVIRNGDMQFLEPSHVFKLSVIVGSLKPNPELIQGNLNLDSYANLIQLIETVFQTAYLGGNDVLILNDCGCLLDAYPVDDVIDVINGSIYKYGHLFKHVVVSIHVTSQSAMGYCSKIAHRIVRPQQLLNEYMQENIGRQSELTTLTNNLNNLNTQFGTMGQIHQHAQTIQAINPAQSNPAQSNPAQSNPAQSDQEDMGLLERLAQLTKIMDKNKPKVVHDYEISN